MSISTEKLYYSQDYRKFYSVDPMKTSMHFYFIHQKNYIYINHYFFMDSTYMPKFKS